MELKQVIRGFLLGYLFAKGMKKEDAVKNT